MQKSQFFCLTITTALLGICGCSDTSARAEHGSTVGGEAGAPGLVSCVEDARVDEYSPQLEKNGAAGVLSFEIVESIPAPPSRGNNRLIVSVKDAAGAPVCTNLSVTLKMPDHGHDTTVVPSITFDAPTGTYAIDPVYLFMPGVWRVGLSVHSEPTAVPFDQVDFFFCIEG